MYSRKIRDTPRVHDRRVRRFRGKKERGKARAAMEDLGHFDVLVIGTSLNSSLRAADFVKSGKKVLIVDECQFYGGLHHSSLSPSKLLTLEEGYEFYMDESIFIEKDKEFLLDFKKLLLDSKEFLLDLSPIILSSAGPLCQKMIELGMSEYLQFRPISKIGLITDNHITMIPNSKEDIFADNSLSLIEKRQLSKLINSFESTLPSEDRYIDILPKISENLLSALFYGILLCDDEDEKQNLSINDAIKRLQFHKCSLGKYASGSSPYLYPVYGSSEVIQAFSRYCAVNGATFIMGSKYFRNGNSISGSYDGQHWKATFTTDIDETEIISCYRTILLIDIPFMNESNTNIWIIKKFVKFLCTGSDSSCSPPGYYIVHVWSHDKNDLNNALAEHFNLPNSNSRPGVPNVLFMTHFKGLEPILGLKSEQTLIDR